MPDQDKGPGAGEAATGERNPNQLNKALIAIRVKATPLRRSRQKGFPGGTP